MSKQKTKTYDILLCALLPSVHIKYTSVHILLSLAFLVFTTHTHTYTLKKKYLTTYLCLLCSVVVYISFSDVYLQYVCIKCVYKHIFLFCPSISQIEIKFNKMKTTIIECAVLCCSL